MPSTSTPVLGSETAVCGFSNVHPSGECLWASCAKGKARSMAGLTPASDGRAQSAL